MTSLYKNFKQKIFPFYSYIIGILPIKIAITIEHRRRIGHYPNLKNPVTFNEKIQWRKINGDHHSYAKLSDKVLVKDHISKSLGKSWVIPSLWHGNDYPPLDHKKWPYPYIIKSNNGSGSVLIINNEAEEEEKKDMIQSLCHYGLKKLYAPFNNEKWYHLINPQILIEPYLGFNLKDYKLYVFNGKVEFIHVDTDRFLNHQRCFFDRNWNSLNIQHKFPMETREISPPASLNLMIKAAEKLGKHFDFVRVDLYDLNGSPRFGELTFAPESGGGAFMPSVWDHRFGRLWVNSKMEDPSQ